MFGDTEERKEGESKTSGGGKKVQNLGLSSRGSYASVILSKIRRGGISPLRGKGGGPDRKNSKRGNKMNRGKRWNRRTIERPTGVRGSEIARKGGGGKGGS